MKNTFLYILCSYCTSMEKLQKSDQLLSNKYVYSEKLWCKAANRGVIWKKSVPTNYTIITGKHLCESLFFNRVVQSRTKYFRQNREIQ